MTRLKGASKKDIEKQLTQAGYQLIRRTSHDIYMNPDTGDRQKVSHGPGKRSKVKNKPMYVPHTKPSMGTCNTCGKDTQSKGQCSWCGSRDIGTN